MQYLCLAYEKENTSRSPSSPEGELLRSETLDYIRELKARGHMICADAFTGSRGAAKVRVRNGKTTVTDAPLSENNERLGGFFLVAARDLNEAIQLASKWPSARFGSIVIRPLEAALTAEDPRRLPQ
ncbi:MAG TPA: YciI family protein [Bacteroidota bacterium]|nr:YciI family protein [Bacteroidota bacterium]